MVLEGGENIRGGLTHNPYHHTNNRHRRRATRRRENTIPETLKRKIQTGILTQFFKDKEWNLCMDITAVRREAFGAYKGTRSTRRRGEVPSSKYREEGTGK